MSGDTVDQLYNGLHADGAVTGTRENFRKFFLAPGKQGYQNRLQLYNALHADGAVSSGTYEEFAQKLGLHARSRSKAVQQAVAYKTQVPNNFGGLDAQTAGMSWLQRQNMTQKQKAASEKRKAVSRGNVVGAGEAVTGQKAATPHVVKPNPNKFFTETQLGNSDLALDYGDNVEGRIHKMEDDKRNAAALLNSQLTKDSFDQIDKAFAEMSGKEIQDNMNMTTDPNDAMGNLFGAMRGANQKYGIDAVIKAYEEALPTIFGSDKSRKAISEQARKLGMDEEEFTQKYMLPNIEKTIHDRLVNEGIPKSDAEYFARGVLSGIAGNIFTRGVMTRQGREIMNEGTEKYLSDLDTRIEKDGVFSKAGLAKYGNIGMGMASDIAAFAGAGKIAGGMMSGLGTGVNLLTKTPLGKRLLGWAATSASGLTKRYGVEGAARIANFASNNKTWLGTLLTDGAKGTLRSGLTLGNYGAMQYATGEGYDKLEDGDTNNWLGGLLNSYSDEFKTGLKFGVVGAVGSTVGRNVGITGAEASNLQKITNGLKKATVSTGAFVAESLAFRTEQMAEEWAKDHNINFTDNFIQGACENMAMKLGGGHIKQFSPKNILRSMTMATGDRGLTLTDTEKKIFLENTDAKNLVAACEALEPNHKTQGEGYTAEDTSGMKYEDRSKTMEKKKVNLSERDAQGNAVGKLQQFLDNKEIPLKLRMKVSAALGGTMGRTIPRASRIVLEQGEKGKYMVKEYSESGELIDAKEHSTYDSAEGDRQDRYLKRQDRDFKDEYLNAMDVTTQEDKMNVMELVAKDNGFESVEDMIHESALRNSQGDDSLDKKIKADYKRRREEYAGTKAKKVLDIQREVSEEYGVDLDKAMDKDFQLRTDQENEAIEEFKKRLRGENTDKNDEAQNNAVARQDGADLSEQTELEDSEKFTENAKSVNDRQASATEAWMEMVKNNPDLAEWMKSNPNASVEELRENFGDDVADAYMELSNAQAMRDGFMQNTGSKIEDAVRNQVEQAKFTGTMQGMGSEDRIFVFIDSAGNEYTLVGGDVVFDKTDFRFKTGESGLIILRDKDGNIVQDKRLEDLYFTNYYSYEEYADVIRKRLQEQKTAEIQSTETPLPEAPKEEAPAEEPKEAPTTQEESKSNEKEKSSDSNKTTDTATVSLKGDTALSQSEDSSSNGKDTTKSSDLQGGNETLTFKDGTEAPKNYDLNDIPMDDNGEPIYESVPKERTVQDLFGKLDDGNLAREYSEMRVSEAEKELKEAKKKEPKMGTKINEYLKKKQEYEDRVKAAEDKVAYWESVKEDIEKLTHTTTEELKEAKEELDGTSAREEFKKTFDETQPADGVALAAKFVADAKVTPESFKKETGMGAAEQKSFVGMIAKEEKGGKSIERLGEDLVYLDNDEYGGVYFHGDSNDARSAIISALTGAKTRKGLREMAEPDMERAVSERAQMRDEAYNERYGMDYEEYLLYSEQEMPHILGNLNNFDEQKYLQDKAVDIINQLDKEYGKVTGENDSRGEESVHVEGDKVLSEERPNDGGGGESPEKHGGGEKDERRSNTPDAPLHETPSRREGGVKSADPSDVAEGIREAAEQFHQERVEKARKAYEEAKASGDTSETKRTKDEYRKALDDKLKAQGIGLVERRKTIAKEMGEEPKVEEPKGEGPKEGKKHWDSLTPTEKVEKADADPLTEEEIRSDEENKELAAAAIAYLNGDKSLLNQIAYLKIYGNVRNRHEDVSGNSGTEDKTQLATSDTGSGEGLGLEPGRSGGGSAEPLDSGTGGEAAPGKRESGTNSEGGPDTAAGEGGDIKGEGNTPGLDGVPAGGGGRERGGTAGSKGNLGSGRGRGSGNGPSKPDGKRKPAAKQGTTFPNSKGSDVKKETSDAKAAMKAAFAEFKKRGKNGSASISLVGMNNEQIEYLPELMKATGRYGIAVMREGIYKAKEWFDNIREAISDDMKDIGFKDADVDEYIREMWHMPWEMDGETHKIGEWASIKGYANLRESLKEPLRKKFDKQVLAEATEVKVGDRKNIEETLPFLLPQQQDDVLKAETQFFDESHKDKAHAGGKGYMFTNGTGTGKTYTGLGIIKRMTKQGKGRILIITPSQQKVKDWINDGKNLCLDIRDLDDWSKEHGSTATNEKGEGVVITTFANFGTNKALLEDQFDAVIYDESHRIMENKEAKETARSRQHYMLTNRNERYALMRLEEVNPDCMKMRGLAEDFENARKKETARIKAEYEKNNPSADAADVRVYMAKNTPRDIQSFSMADKAKHPELGKIYEDYRKARDYYINNVKPELEKQAKESVDKTKVVFLSATPFNTRENIEYAEGYLFSYPERNESGQSGKAQFFLDHFGAGYKFRYNRLERSTANAEALAKQEVAFSDWLQNDLGTMSGRIIDSPYDYSRDFPTVSVEHARDFNEACEEISRDDVFGAAYREVLGDYNYGSALFETMKVAAMLPRLREHIAAGRKVVVFHRRVSSKEPLQAPFGMILGENAEKAIKKLPKDKQPEARTRLNELRSKYSELLKWEQTLDFSMPREQLAKAFGEDNVLYFSGQESSKVKNEAVKQFNDDNSGKNIIVIQEASGKEGISLHDTTGKHQRVCITLALPQSPITALQIEGRTYRIGNESNAIFEYPVLGLVSEYNLFASKFNQQVSTTENLALGSQARNLRESFARGIEEHSGYVPLDQQGVGGKDFDKADESDSDPYDNAILDYYTNQKLNRNNREGVDYFPTPEPLGYKIVEWANIGEGDSVLEPSAGHGAIARYAPQSNELVAIEPSMSLFAKLQMKAGGLGRKFQNDTFENYYIGNKHDTVVMNPPFGKAGATAIAHVGKAFGHLEEGGRVVAIIPRGAMDKKFDKWYEGEKSAVLRAEIDLPDIVFEQAGTKVRCRVVVIDKITDSSLRARAEMTQVDLNRHYDKIEDFFEDLRDVEVAERIIDQQAKQMKKSKATVSELRNMRGVYDVSLDRDGIEVGARGVRERIEFKENESADAFKKRMAGLYDQFAQNEKRCANYNMDASAVYGELKDLTCKLADMTEDEMRRYLTSNNGVRFRMELGKTFSDTKEDFDGVRDRAVKEKGIVMPNLNKESVKVVPVEKHGFDGDSGTAIENARSWAKENLVTKDKNDLPTMRDGTPYTISKKAVDKYLSESAIDKSDALSVHLSVLPNLKEVIHESLETEIHPDYNKGEDGNRNAENGYGDNVLVHRLYGAVELDGKTYRVKTTMQEFRGGEENKPHSYEVTKIELLGAPGTAVLPDSSPLDTTPNNSISAAKLLKGVEKSYDKGKKLLDESKDLAQGEIRFRNEGEMTPEERREERRLDEHRSTVEKAAEKLNTDVTICESIDDVTNAEARAAIERGERVKAWYDTRTGEVHLYLPNVTDKYDAQKSIAHEVIGHKGMRGLLGEDGYRTMLRRMYTHLSDTEAREVNERMMRNGWDFYTAMDEWVADKAEESVWQPQEYPKYIGLSNLWSHIKKSVTEAMHKAGYYINPNVDDVKYWLWESKRALRDGNAETEMRRNAFLWKLGHEKMNDDVVMGEYTGDGEAEDKTSKPLYRNTLDFNKNDTPTNAATKETIERELTSRSFRRTEAWTDDKNGYRVFQSEMAKGVDDFNSSMDAYHGAINQSSTVAEKQKNFERRELREMEEAIKKPVKLLGGGQKGYEALNLYLFMKSGLERNRVLLARDVADKIDGKIRKLNKELLAKDPASGTITYNGVEHFRDEFHAEKDYLTTLLEQGQIDLHQYYSELDRFIKTFEFAMTGDNVVDAKIAELNKWYKDNIGDKYEPNSNDYSGISSIVQHRQNGAFSDGAIIDAVMQTENTMGGADEVDNLWSAIKPVTNYGLECDFENGIISKAAAERAKKMFNWYVPMRGFDQETMEDSYSYMRGDSRIESKSLATAKGRTTLATSPLGTAAAMASKAIARGEDNANKQRAYRLVNAWLKNHTETDANGQQKLTEVAPAMISDVWFERKYDSLGNEYWEVASPKITEKMTSEEIRQEIEDFKDDMKAKEAQGGATRTLQKGVFAKPFEAGAHKTQNVVNVWIGGKMKQIIFTGNPRPAQALNGELKSDVRQLKLMRMMAGMFTSYNVTFSISNLSRDTLFANNNIANKESAAYYKKFVTLQTRLLGGMGLGMATMNSSKHIRGEYFNMWANYKKGIPPKSKLEKLFYEFMDNGGKTGFVTTKTINNFETEIRKAATGGNVWDFAGKCFKAIPEVIEGLNERSENLNRFACYATSRMMGRSIMRSVTDAKEVSTNFNRRGLGSKAYDVPEASSFGKFTGVVADWCKRCYLFFNAGMQSLRLLSTNLKNHPIRTSAYTVGIPMVFGGMLIPMLNQWLADDDGETYANLPDWDRRNNICLYMGKGKWFKIPLPIELRAFYGLGDLTRSYFDKRLRSEKNIVAETMAQLSQILPWDFMGDGNDITAAAWPDVLKPIVQVYRNKDWTGKPIYKDYDYMKNDPEYTKVYKGEFEPLVNMSKFINEMSGGTSVSKGSADGLWNNPAVWSNIINGYFGGAGSDAMRVYRLGERAVTGNGKDFSVREVPMLRALISTPTEKTLYYRALNKYAASLEEAKKLEHDIKKWKDNLEDPEISMKYHSVVRKGSPELQKLAIIEASEYVIKQARKVMNDKSTPEETKNKIQLLIDKQKMDVVKELEDLE